MKDELSRMDATAQAQLDEEREAFDRWQTTVGWDLRDSTFEAWKAGREELRRALEIRDARTEQEHAAELEEPAWIPWEGGECPLSDTVKRWEYEVRAGVIEPGEEINPRHLRWAHTGGDGDIVAYRVLEG